MKYYGGLNPSNIEELYLNEINSYLIGIDILKTEEFQAMYDFSLLSRVNDKGREQIKRYYLGDRIITNEEQVSATKELAAFCSGF
ncbi:MAG: hypothetical protein ACFFG0_04620 [Candidatus Thorarchaeota archaeon]